ncbi:Nitrogen fixation protein FixH [Pricia antarctica]|uniref:Nitrogen fixation protein FixH n=1 Tax=Pricia antarctica TaxID=641691 RepID=A0A1G7D7L0_9FLAO|nr:FixH family protein [Pricia antarctica]SDE46980.1 Nitrogen fixation protein FixH [Pricia antarctica]
MKLNWGTSIVIAFVAFISFILFFVVRMNTDYRANHDLVTEDYYKATLEYQEEIDAEENANSKAPLKVEKSSEGVQLTFPENLNLETIKGLVSLYRPSNKNLDFEIPISLSNTHLLIPASRLLDGRWNIKVTWEYEGEKYLHKESLMY